MSKLYNDTKEVENIHMEYGDMSYVLVCQDTYMQSS